MHTVKYALPFAVNTLLIYDKNFSLDLSQGQLKVLFSLASAYL